MTIHSEIRLLKPCVFTQSGSRTVSRTTQRSNDYCKRIAEERMLELLQHAKDAEAREIGFPEAGSYFRACAHTVYAAWRDITDGWHTDDDVERLESLIGLPIWVGVS
jgi:hypothetical protein